MVLISLVLFKVSAVLSISGHLMFYEGSPTGDYGISSTIVKQQPCVYAFILSKCLVV